MFLKFCLISFTFVIFGNIGIWAQNIYLKNGENISGKITGIQENVLTIESTQGYGILEIPESDIIMITFPESTLNLARRYGIGYSSKRNISFAAGSQFDYALDQVSMKTFVTPELFLQYLTGYGEITVVDTSNQEQKISAFSFDLRMGGSLIRADTSMVYTGASVGYLNIKDTTKGISEQGASYSVFVGGEVFISTLPDFGFSGELVISHQSTKSLKQFNLSITAIPTLSMHYYF